MDEVGRETLETLGFEQTGSYVRYVCEVAEGN